MSDVISDPTPDPVGDVVRRIERAAMLIEQRVVALEASAGRAEAKGLALAALQDEVERIVGDLDGMIARQQGNGDHG